MIILPVSLGYNDIFNINKSGKKYERNTFQDKLNELTKQEKEVNPVNINPFESFEQINQTVNILNTLKEKAKRQSEEDLNNQLKDEIYRKINDDFRISFDNYKIIQPININKNPINTTNRKNLLILPNLLTIPNSK